MLNLITGQVTHRSSHTVSHDSTKNPQRLTDIVHRYISRVIHSNVTSKPRNTVCVDDFKTKSGSNDTYYLELFLKVSINVQLIG